MSFDDLYPGRHRHACEAMDCIRDGDRVVVPTSAAEARPLGLQGLFVAGRVR